MVAEPGHGWWWVNSRFAQELEVEQLGLIAYDAVADYREFRARMLDRLHPIQLDSLTAEGTAQLAWYQQPVRDVH